MKTLNGIDASSKPRSTQSEQSSRKKDFALELAKADGRQVETSPSFHAPEAWPVNEPSHAKEPTPKRDALSSMFSASPLETTAALKMPSADHLLPAQEAALMNGIELGPLGTIRGAPTVFPAIKPMAKVDQPMAPTLPQEIIPSTMVGASVSPVPAATKTLPVGRIEEAKDSLTGMDAMFGAEEAKADLAQPLPMPQALESETWSRLSMQQQLNVTVAPTGVTEDLLGSRIFGVHLLASTYLSQLTTREEGSADGDLMPAAPMPVANETPGVHQTSIAGAISDSPDAESEPASKDEAEIILSLIVEESMTSAADNARAPRSTALASSVAANLTWPESLLRLTRGSDGKTVVWLRDYRMGVDEASSMANALVEGARARGAHVGRIVLNGREIWVSQNNC